ncbi:MAG: TIGR02147 family protein [Fibrobacterota bacterium]|nr:TIGR02147 family protein [Fibrobacterota bacterium]QQS04767.1 MAG: TIGR02147 family protein [Fibrobacterota bacterium]
MNDPIVYEFHDFRAWLAAWFAYQSSEVEPELSKSEVSRRLGLPRTRSYFTDVLRGKIVSPVFVERFVELTELNRTEAKYFRALVRFGQATDPREREEAFDDVVALNRVPWAKAAGDSWEYYKDWRNQLVRALLLVGECTGDWEALAKKSLLPISAVEVKKTIAVLERLGMVSKADGVWKPAQPSLSTGTGLSEKILRQAQMVQLEHIRDDLLHDSDGRPPRKVTTTLVSVSGSGLERILVRMDRLRSEIRAIAHRDPSPADRVYLVAIAAVPLTRTREEQP